MPKKVDISGIFRNLGQKFRKTVNHEFLTYLVFLLIAIVIWYLNALSKEYTADLKFKVKYTGLPEDKVLVTPPPDYLSLTVSAQGFTLLKYRFGMIFSPITLEAGYSTLRRNRTSADGKYFIATQYISDKVAGQLSSEIRLRNIMPDTLNFFFSETVKREVPVKVLAQLQFEKGFLPKGKMQVAPPAVTVVGPKAVIDTMRHVYTREKTYKRLKDTLRAELALQPVHQLRYSVSAITVLQPIERYTEATIAIPVEPVNLPPGLTMKTFPGTVTVNCMVPVSDFEKLQPYMFRAAADYATVKDVKENQAKVRITMVKSPDYVSDIRFQPRSVDFVIEK